MTIYTISEFDHHSPMDSYVTRLEDVKHLAAEMFGRRYPCDSLTVEIDTEAMVVNVDDSLMQDGDAYRLHILEEFKIIS